MYMALAVVLSLSLIPAGLQAQTAADADFDDNGKVEFADFLLFVKAYGSAQVKYDLNGNGKVDFADFLAFVRVYGQNSPPAGGGGDTTVVTTPANTRHEMVLVPAGAFTMGSDSGGSDERPVHKVYLDGYYIDGYEVTNMQYVAFMNAIGRSADSEGHDLLSVEGDMQIRQSEGAFELKSSEYADLPVARVSWYGAKAYCEWTGGRLPTEAEWEKAARGTDGRTYPWGNELDSRRANYWDSGDPFDNGATAVIT